MKMNTCTGFTAALAAILVVMSAPVDAQTAFTIAKRAPSVNADRHGDVPRGAVIRTDERYNRNGLFQGPRGWDYWNLLENPKPYQNPNLWPDKRPTYFLGQMVMPAGSFLTLRGRFPYARYFKFNAYRFEHNTFVAIAGSSLPGYDIEPDPGSGNPFKVGADRLIKNRHWTIHVLAEDPPQNPADHPRNTVYVGRDEKMILAGFRIYVSDKSYDGAGWGPGAGGWAFVRRARRHLRGQARGRDPALGRAGRTAVRAAHGFSAAAPDRRRVVQAGQQQGQ
jgi:hypothetical protein